MNNGGLSAGYATAAQIEATPSDEELANFLDTIATLSRLGNLQEFCAIPAVIRALKDSASRLRSYGQKFAQAYDNKFDTRAFQRYIDQQAKDREAAKQVYVVNKDLVPKDAWKVICNADDIK